MNRKLAKHRRSEAERAAEWFCRERLDCVITRRAVRTKWQKVDFFCADVVGKRPDGSHIYIQVTAGQESAVRARIKKLNKIPWHSSDIVLLLQMREPAPRELYFRVYEYIGEFNRTWLKDSKDFPIPDHWLRAWKEPRDTTDSTQGNSGSFVSL